MSKSNRSLLRGRRGGTVTVIEEPVRRSAVRNAKITACVTWAIVTILAANIGSSYIHPPALALITGIFIGLAAAAVTGTLVAAWPVIRALWWWLPELVLITGLADGWITLAAHAPLITRIAVTTLTIGIPAALAPIRRRLIATAWCLITRHRLRVCFNEFIISNRTGSLPLILWARPTSVGERVWLFLRPGLAMDDIQGQLDKIAVACWGRHASAEPASESNSAFIRMDIKRRDALTGTVASPLLALITGKRTEPESLGFTDPAAENLDLTDVTPEDVEPVAKTAPGRQPRWPHAAPAAVTPAAPLSDSADSDWI